MSRNERWSRYVKKTLTPITVRVPIPMAEEFKNKCKEKNIPQAQIFKNAITKFLEE